jgi:hypothetical protein
MRQVCGEAGELDGICGTGFSREEARVYTVHFAV